MVRMSGTSLATVIVRSDALCVFRTTNMSGVAGTLDPQSRSRRNFPVGCLLSGYLGCGHRPRPLAGFADRTDAFRAAISQEMKCPVESLGEGALHSLPGDARTLMNQGLEPLVGWMMNGVS